MLLVDFRTGSQELIEPLRNLGLDVAEADLQFGDIAFEGKGIGGKPVDIGVEFKRLEEFVDATRTGRLTGHQLPGMRGRKDGADPLYDYAWLLIEGRVMYDQRGKLQKRVGRAFTTAIPGGMTINELYKRLLSIQLGWGVQWVLTETRRDSLKFIEALYRSWTDRAQDEHESHVDIYVPPALEGVSDFRQTVSSAMFPGVSLAVSQAAEKAFGGSLRRAVNASVDEWAALEIKDKNGHVKRFGRKRAERLKEKLA